MKTGRRDSKESHIKEVEDFIPNHNDSMSLVLSRFEPIGIDVEATVALLGIYVTYQLKLKAPPPTLTFTSIFNQSKVKHKNKHLSLHKRK